MSDRLRRVAGAVLILAALVALPSGKPARAQNAPPAASRKLMRDITVLEKIIDQMLLDSKNLLVYSNENTARGLYLDEFGVLFSFQASLVDRDMSESWEGLEGLKDYGFEIKEVDGQIVVIRPKEKAKIKEKPGADTSSEDDEDTPAAAPKAPATPEPPRTPKPPKLPRILEWNRHRDSTNQAKLYAAGKAEIIETLLDYGDTMNSLRDNQWLAIAAFLRNSDYFIDNRISRLVVKARMNDLRAYAAGRLSEDQMKARVVQEEY